MTLKFFPLLLITGIAALTSCSEAPKATETTTTAPKEITPNEPVTVKTAFWPMYKEAYAWSKDVVILKVEPKDLPGFKSADGKAPEWDAVFASPSRKEMHTWSYSIVKHGDVPRGVSVSSAVLWAGPRRDAMPFATADLGVDTDVAYKAAAKAAEVWTKKHPEASVTYTLGSAMQYPAPVWYFLWGNTKQGFAAYVNSRSGELMNSKAPRT